jgi:hypothetical protein
MSRIFAWVLGGCILASVAFTLNAQSSNADQVTYKTGWASMVKLGMELHRGLKAEYKPLVHVKPINIDPDPTPFVRLEELKDPSLPAPTATVLVSAGFIDLVNNVAHAKAIDRIEKGFFERYILSLAQESGEQELKPLPNIEDKRYWTFNMMNEQLSNFNQIVGEVVAIKLAHYYLGHYKKYADKLVDANGTKVPINTLLTTEEWDEAVRCGVRNALDCGLGIDGVKALYDCIDKMPRRPSWTLSFLPEKVKVSKLKKDLEKIEKKFLQNQ